MYFGIGHAQQNERDQCHAGNAISLEAISARADRVARVIAGAVGDYTGIAGIVFFDLEDDLHQVRADVGNFRKDAAGDTQCGCAKRFTDRESDEAWAGVIARHKQQNEKHDQQLDADQQHSNAHSSLERNCI